MNYKQFLIDSQKSGVSALLTFVLQYHRFNKVVASFVEGNDFSFYNPRVSENVDKDNELLFYPCNGKREVELVREMVKSNLHPQKDVKILYFCDSDYGIDKKIDNIFYTDFYSVENYYTTERFIANVLKNVFNINKYNPDYEIAISLYRERYNQFNEQIIKINAYCYGLRIIEKKLKKSRTNLNGIQLRDFVENDNFENFKMKEFEYNDIKELISADLVVPEDEYNNHLKEIDKTKLRGKWELSFIVWFLDGLRLEIKKGGCGLSKNSRNVIAFQNEIMTSMERNALTTEKLIEYIKSNT